MNITQSGLALLWLFWEMVVSGLLTRSILLATLVTRSKVLYLMIESYLHTFYYLTYRRSGDRIFRSCEKNYFRSLFRSLEILSPDHESLFLQVALLLFLSWRVLCGRYRRLPRDPVYDNLILIGNWKSIICFFVLFIALVL